MLDEAGVEFFHSPTHQPYATLGVNGYRKTLPVRGEEFKSILASYWHGRIGTVLASRVVSDTIAHLSAVAISDGAQKEVFSRVGSIGGEIHLDLGREDCKMIRIKPGSWDVEKTSSVKFVRPKGMQPLPLPTRDPGARDHLFNLLGLDRDQFDLIVAALVGAFRPSGPHPVLVFQGAHGSAKSTRCRLVQRLVDPSIANLRSQPQSERDLAIATAHTWMLAFDNISAIPQWLSDAFCKIATGGAFATRTLYTDSDETLFRLQRPIVLNGIGEFFSAPDLLDRSIVIQLPEIPPDRRVTERKFWEEFKEYQPGILAWLLDAVASALARVDSVALSRSPRMADFAEWITAAEPALGWKEGRFLEIYEANRVESNYQSLDGDPIGRELMLVAQRGFKGTLAELLEQLNSSMWEGVPKDWPRTPKALSNAIRRLMPNLAAEGVMVEFTRSNGVRQVAIRMKDTQCLKAPATVPEGGAE
jgi:hypothetical protein